MAKETIERKVAETILHYPQNIKIGGKKYRLARLTFSTIVEMSAVVSEIPQDISESKANIIIATLRHGKDYKGAPKVLAVAMVSTMWMLFGRFGHWVFRCKVNRKAVKLAAIHSSQELNEAAQELIQITDLAHFFALTTFLAGINMTKATKVEAEAEETPTTETQTTASGR